MRFLLGRAIAVVGVCDVLLFGASCVRAQSLPDVFRPSVEVQALAPADLPPVDTLSLLSPFVRRTKKLARGPHQDAVYQWRDWTARALLSVGQGFTDNVFSQPSSRVATPYSHIRPTVGLFRGTGLHSTALFASGDFNFYTATPIPNSLSARAGAMHTYSPAPGLDFILKGEYGHYAYGFSNGLVFSPIGVSVNPSTNFIYTSPLQSDQYSASLAAMKSFNRLFVGFGAAATRSNYFTVYTQAGPYGQFMRDSLLAGGTGRVGFALTPELYVFASPSGYSRSYDNNSRYNSDGYQMLAGVGLDRRLWKIELSGGYQQQFFINSAIKTVSAPTLNAIAIWRPTPILTFSAFATQSIQDPGLTPGPLPTLNLYRVLSSGITANYEFSARLAANLHGGFSELSQVNFGRRQDVWNGGTTLTYKLDRNLNAYFDYAFTSSASSAQILSYERNIFLVGLRYSR